MIMQCVNDKCGKRTTKEEATDRIYGTGACVHCGWGLAEVTALPNQVAGSLDVIFSETYLPIQVRTHLENLIVEYAAAQHFDGRQEATNHIEKDMTNYGVSGADYVIGLYKDILKEEAK